MQLWRRNIVLELMWEEPALNAVSFLQTVLCWKNGKFPQEQKIAVLRFFRTLQKQSMKRQQNAVLQKMSLREWESEFRVL